MSEFRRRFDPSELGAAADVDQAELIEIARDLETYAEAGWSGPTARFEDRVMAAITDEPAPRLLGGSGLIGLLRQAWQLAWSGGRPLMIRTQALALLLIAAVALGGVGSLAAVAAGRLLAPTTSPAPTIQPTPLPPPSPLPSPSPSIETAMPSPSVPVARTPSPSPTETEHASGTDDHGGGSGSGSGSGGGTSGSGGSSGSGGGSSGSRSDDSGGSNSGPGGGSSDDRTPEPTSQGD